MLTAQKIANQLNFWLEKDYDAILELTWYMYIKGNQKLEEDPYIILRGFDEENIKNNPNLEGGHVTPLGTINGLLIAAGSQSVVTASFDENSKLTKFSTREITDAEIAEISRLEKEN